MPLADPWYDYLAIPYAPLLLVVQVGVLFVRRTLWRWGISVACTAAITAMFLYVGSIPEKAGEGVNLGTPLLLLWLGVSVVLLIVLIVRDLLAAGIRRVASESDRASVS
jgi:hypothetical protein